MTFCLTVPLKERSNVPAGPTHKISESGKDTAADLVREMEHLQVSNIDESEQNSSVSNTGTILKEQPFVTINLRLKRVHLKVKHGTSAVHHSHMASSSRRKPPAQSGSAASSAPSAPNYVKVSGHSPSTTTLPKWHLVVKCTIGDKDKLTFDDAVIDSTSTDILINGAVFWEAVLEADSDVNGFKASGRTKEIIVKYPEIGKLKLTATPYVSSFTIVDEHNSITVENQTFYVVEDLPFPMVIGTYVSSHKTSSLIENIVKSKGLPGRMVSYNIPPWSDNVADALKGSTMHIGAIDKDIVYYYGKNLHCKFVRMDDNPSSGHHIGTKVKYGDQTIVEVLGSGIDNRLIVDFNTVSPAILLSEDRFSEYKHCLEESGINVFFVLTVEDNKPDIPIIRSGDMAKLKALTFSFRDQYKLSHEVEIPGLNQVYPVGIGKEIGVPEGYHGLAVQKITGNSEADIILGVPFCELFDSSLWSKVVTDSAKVQQRYVIYDCVNTPGLIGFAHRKADRKRVQKKGEGQSSTRSTGESSSAAKRTADKAQLGQPQGRESTKKSS